MWRTFSKNAFIVYQQQCKQIVRDMSFWRPPTAGDLIRSNCFQTTNSSISTRTAVTKTCSNSFQSVSRFYCNNAAVCGALKSSPIFNSFHKSGKSIFTKISHHHQQQRCFRTSPQNNALPPIVVILLGRIAKVGAVIFGRTMRRWWQKLPPEERAKYAAKVRRNRYIAGGVAGSLAFAAFVYYETHVQTTPYTERKRFLAFNNDQIVAMSKQELEVLLQFHEKSIIPASSGKEVYRKIVRVATQLLKGNEGIPQLQGLNWTVTVVDADECNAFVLPCGSIFVFSGLLKVCDSDDQLGIILAHEMAHAVMGHGAEKASFLHLLDLLFVIPLAALWAILPTDLIAAFSHWVTATLSQILMELPHSRFIEEEADKVGLILAAQSCFDIREAPVVWAKIGLMEQDNISIEWLSTHPSHERRQAQLEEMLSDAIAHREQCQCPRLPYIDPRLKIKYYQEGARKHNKLRLENLAVPIKV